MQSAAAVIASQNGHWNAAEIGKLRFMFGTSFVKPKGREFKDKMAVVLPVRGMPTPSIA